MPPEQSIQRTGSGSFSKALMSHGSGLTRPSLFHTVAEVLLSAAVWVMKLEGRREAEKHRGGTGLCGTFYHGCR